MIPNNLSPWQALSFQPRSYLHLVAQVGAADNAPAPGAARGAPAGGGGAGAASSPFGSMIPLLLFGVIFYLMVFRPMSKQKKEQEELGKSLRKGDKVVTRSGIIGTISGLDDREVVLEVAEKVRVKFVRDAIEKKYDPSAGAEKSTETAAVEKK